jgi:hypothetical protein
VGVELWKVEVGPGLAQDLVGMDRCELVAVPEQHLGVDGSNNQRACLYIALTLMQIS